MFNFQNRPCKREIYFHEDDYCQQHLLPVEAEKETILQLDEAETFASEHLAEDGVGWTDIYRIEEASVTIGDLKIRREDLCKHLNAIIPQYDVVYTGTVSHWERCENTGCWGDDFDCAVFADWDADGFINSIWTSFFDPAETAMSKATDVISSLTGFHPMIYVDWAWGYCCRAEDKEVFYSKLKDKLETIAERAR